MGSVHATGIEVIFAVLKVSIIRPTPWILAMALFATFFGTSRSGNKPLRVAFFWIPTVTISCIGITLASAITYLMVKFKP